jgi:hypothetical protein
MAGATALASEAALPAGALADVSCEYGICGLLGVRVRRVAGPGTAGVVSRPGLWERLGAAGRVTVVSAPAGSGKTVLLRSWISGGGPGRAGGVGAQWGGFGGRADGAGRRARGWLQTGAPDRVHGPHPQVPCGQDPSPAAGGGGRTIPGPGQARSNRSWFMTSSAAGPPAWLLRAASAAADQLVLGDAELGEKAVVLDQVG